jgi:hypothetical protein
MAGLMLNPQIINQDWGTAVLSVARDLALCKGINDVLSDTDRMPGGGSAALQSLGLSSSDAGLIVATFSDLAALYRVGHAQQQQVGNNDFFFNAKKLLGTVPMPL